MNFGRHSQDDLTLDVTPLIDVVFLLLIFFMVTTTFASRSGIGVKLPEAQAKERPPGHVVELTLTTKGELFLDKGKVATGGLAAALAATAKAHPGEVVVIRADAAVPHGRVVKAMDAARAAGFHKLAIATRAPE
jgi:biopolymer transport protein ExbD